ncbi:MAG TPA: ATP-binding protein [Actinomycetes bacterium]|jgi:two-component sensor histidine kinase|nr:ATP-binding protein [Actinomycetes bacterium]
MSQRSAEVKLDPLPQSAGRARQFVQRTLGTWQVVATTVETAVLLANELVTNALRHGRGRVALRVEKRRRSVRVSVHDADPRPPRPAAPDPEAENGRGLRLVELLAERWGTEPVPGHGKRVWFELGPT